MSNIADKHLFTSGHTACAGCGQSIAARLVIDASGANTMIANNTGCLEVFSSKYPESAWEVPWIHSLFENAAAVASGIEAALKYLGIKDKINVIAEAGDGGTADIGLQALSGMWERGQDILSVCYDNEAYMNCLSISSLIMTKQGLKNILDIKVGDEVVAFEQNTYNLVYKKCTGIFDNGIKGVYELTTPHHSIKATSNHPFLVLKRNGRGKKNNFVWKVLEEIKAGEEVVTLKTVVEEKSFDFAFIKKEKGDYKVNKINAVEIPKNSSPDLMKYLGMYVGDGWTREEKAEVGFALPENSEERKEFLNLHNRLFKCKLSQDRMYVYARSVNLARFISSLGFKKGAKNKTIPDWVFTLPAGEKEAFIEGLMLSDGYKFNGSWRYVSSSTDLLKRLRLLAQITGFRAGKIHWQNVKRGRKCVKRRLLKDTGFGYVCMSRRREPDINKWFSQTKYRNFLADNKYFDAEKVKKIKYAGEEPTLDLRVEDEHNFVADGIVVHNTGIQRSGLTPFGTNTTTSPSGTQSLGNPRPKKPMPEIALAHGIPYVATASVGFPQDLQRKIKKAHTIKGPKYIQIHVPCPLGWRHESALTYDIAKLAVETGLFPLIEYENGVLVARRQITPKPVEEYLKPQGRFKHILNDAQALKAVQEIADNNIKKYNLKVETQAAT
jgi:pyruvate/2-oxoacid:ferredoxin oxidoreductase beta subunit/intein/homing endonuclease